MLLFPVFRRRTACVFLKGSAEIRNVAVTGHHGNLVNLTVGIAHQILRLFHAQLQKIIGKGHPGLTLKGCAEPGAAESRGNSRVLHGQGRAAVIFLHIGKGLHHRPGINAGFLAAHILADTLQVFPQHADGLSNGLASNQLLIFLHRILKHQIRAYSRISQFLKDRAVKAADHELHIDIGIHPGLLKQLLQLSHTLFEKLDIAAFHRGDKVDIQYGRRIALLFIPLDILETQILVVASDVF